MATIGTYVATFTADMGGFLKPLDAAFKEIGKVQDAIKETEKTQSSWASTAAKAGAAITAAGTAIGGVMLAMAKKTADFGEALRDASIRTGVSVEELSRLGYAAQSSGSSFEELEGGLRVLSRNANEAAQGSKAQAQAFRELGVSVTDTSGHMKPANELLLQISDRFQTMPDGVRKSALSMEFFGKTGTGLIQFLNEGSYGIQKMGTNLEEMGGLFSTEAAEAANKFNQSLKDVGIALNGLYQAIGTAILPALTDLAKSITPIVSGFSKWTAEMPRLVQLVGQFAAILFGAGGLLAGFGVLAKILPAVTTGLAGIGLAISGVSLITGVGVIAALVAVAIEFRKEISGFFVQALSLASRALGDFFRLAAEIIPVLGLGGLSGGLTIAANLSEKFAKAVDDVGASLKETKKETLGVADANAAVIKYFQEQQEAARQAAEAHAKLAEEIKEARNSILGIKQPTEAWMIALRDLEKTGRLSLDAILGLEDEIKGLKDSTDPLIAKYRALIPLIKQATSNYEAQKLATEGLAKVNRDLSSIKLPEWMRSSDPIISAPLVPERWEEDLERDMNEAYRGMIAIQEGIRDEQKKTADQAKKSMQDAFEDVKRSAGAIFDAMRVKGESVFSSLSNLAKGWGLTLGRTIFQEISAALFAPLTKAFEDFFTGIIQSLGLKKLGEKLGGLIPGISGGTAAAGGIGAGAGAGGGISGGALAGFFTNPFTIGIGAALGLGAFAINKWVGQGRKTADKFVAEFQNPFNEAIANVHDTFFQAAETGSLTVEEAKEAHRQVLALWNTFKTESAKFAQQGENEAKVVGQAFAEMAKYWGQDLSVILGGFNKVIEGLLPPVELPYGNPAQYAPWATSYDSGASIPPMQITPTSPAPVNAKYVSDQMYGQTQAPQVTINGIWLGDQSGINELARQISQEVLHGRVQLIASATL
jgi:hypothetical protein